MIRLTQSKSVARFSGALWGPIHERPIVDRVMSTSQWPVPYYQRIFKAYPVRQNKQTWAMNLAGAEIHDINWYCAKQALSRTLKGRQAVEYVENNIPTQSYIVIQKDVSRMAKAYVSDLSLFLSVANKESKVILDSVELI
ncbi:unnamed protein product [Paramecium pentaurelia]|uniref:Uncharacterized protein n=1 Tax=Paramecium pentaurelia TaxID=43138 RepID=A0A8S1SPQ1_9CILI|nr:unnamed protein product [Paramecium pentaurelia]